MLAGPIEGTRRDPRGAADAGYELHALTNWSAETFPIARARFAFLDRFETILVSGDVRLIKPDARIFQLLLERIGASGATLHLHRRQSPTNVAAAAALGFDAIHFTAPPQLRAASGRARPARGPGAGLRCAGAALACGGLIGLVLLVSIGLAGGFFWLRQSLPQIDGEIEVAGARARRSTIVRDAHGRSRTSRPRALRDAVFAQGFVHAQDRLWQMEFQRRLGAGRLAEILGAGGAADRPLHAHAGLLPRGARPASRICGPTTRRAARGLCRRASTRISRPAAGRCRPSS